MSTLFPFNELFRAPLIQLIPRASKFRSTFDALRTRSYEKFLFYVWSRSDCNFVSLAYCREFYLPHLYLPILFSIILFPTPPPPTPPLHPQSSLQTHSDVNEHWIKHLLVRSVLLLFRYILMQVLRGLLGVKYRVTNKVILLLRSAELFIHRAWRIIALRGGGGWNCGGCGFLVASEDNSIRGTFHELFLACALFLKMEISSRTARPLLLVLDAGSVHSGWSNRGTAGGGGGGGCLNMT